MKNYQNMNDKEFAKFLKLATAEEMVKAFCKGKTHEEIEADIKRAEGVS